VRRYTRKEVDQLTNFAKEQGAEGIGHTGIHLRGYKGTAQKFITPEEAEALKARSGAAEGDLILFVADSKAVANKTLGALRLLFRDRLALADKDMLAFVWVVDFPMFDWDEEEQKWDAAHHPFTMPQLDDLEKFDTDPASILSDAYDMVTNGYETASGSIRIHRRDIQLKIFQMLGLTDDDIQANSATCWRPLSSVHRRTAAWRLASTAWSCCWRMNPISAK
jgi:aspartyl-tRNA synthetase